jgi:hypothetical protein
MGVVGLTIQCVGILLVMSLSLLMTRSIKRHSLTYWTAAWVSLSLSLLSLSVAFQFQIVEDWFYGFYYLGESTTWVNIPLATSFIWGVRIMPREGGLRDGTSSSSGGCRFSPSAWRLSPFNRACASSRTSPPWARSSCWLFWRSLWHDASEREGSGYV